MKYIEKHFNKIILIFLYLQPVIDVLTSFSINMLDHHISFGMISRVTFIIFLFFYFLFNKNSKNKTTNIKILLSLMAYLSLFVVNLLYVKDRSVLSYELQNTFRTFYFTFVLVLINSTQTKKIKIKHIVNILLIYMAFIIVPIVTKTSQVAYTHGKIGEVGWFNSANEISGIFSILFPFLFKYIKNLKNNYLKVGLSIITVYSFTVLGTKMTVVSIFITLAIYGFIYFKNKVKAKEFKEIKTISAFLIVGLASLIIILPTTNFYKNIMIHVNYLEITKVREVFTKENFDHFVFSCRLSFFSDTKYNYNNSPINEKLIGMGYIENYGTDKVNLKLIEMDFFDIFFRHGIIGFSLYTVLFVLFSIQVIRRRQLNYLISLFTTIFVATLVGHVVTSPAVSIYVIMMLTNNIEESYEK